MAVAQLTTHLHWQKASARSASRGDPPCFLKSEFLSDRVAVLCLRFAARWCAAPLPSRANARRCQSGLSLRSRYVQVQSRVHARGTLGGGRHHRRAGIAAATCRASCPISGPTHAVCEQSPSDRTGDGISITGCARWDGFRCHEHTVVVTVLNHGFFTLGSLRGKCRRHCDFARKT